MQLYIKFSMTQKSRRLNVAHPLELFSQQRKEHKNIF